MGSGGRSGSVDSNPDSLAVAAERAMHDGSYEDALARFQSALDIDPKHTASLRGLVELSCKLDDPTTALHYHDALAESGNDTPGEYVSLSRALTRVGERRRGREIVATGLDRFPADGALHVEAARGDIASGQTRSAKAHLKTAMETGGSGGREAHAMLANMLFDGEEYDTALELLEGFERKYPGDFNVNMRAAYIHYSRESFESAEDCYRRAVDARPKSIDARVGLAKSQEKQGKADVAIRTYDKALKVKGLSRQSEPIVLAQCNLLNKRGKYPRSLELIERCEREFELTAGLYCARGVALAAEGVYDDALSAFQHATSDQQYGEFALAQIRRVEQLRVHSR